MSTITTSQSLRVVGQEFEKYKVSDFDVEFGSDGCRVRGTVPPTPVAPPQPVSPKWSIKGLFKPAADQVAPEVVDAGPDTWERRYSWSELNHLDHEYRTQRRGTGGVPDDYSTAQVLRVVGAYAERQRWALAGVARTQHVIEIRHHKPDGRLQADSLRFAELYDFSVRLSQMRSRAVVGQSQ